MTGSLELFSATVCPYAHRTRLVLLEKGIDCPVTEIDFKAKPERFLKVSAYGKVPAIVHDGVEIYESAIINEYLDEVFPEPRLMPDDPGERAQARIWIDYCDDHFLDDYYKAIRSGDPDGAAELKQRIETHLQRLEAAMAKLSPTGPFWLGDKVGLVDFAYYPFFERLPAWEHYRGISIPEGCDRLSAWCDTMRALPNVRAIANPPEYYIERYAGYAKAA